jgi:hypothetical protein
MLEKGKLRKADVFSGAVMSLFGLWIVSQALQMPMKDSWGGVMDVWYVSPALLPLSIGVIIILLGLMLCRIALKAIGVEEFKNTVRWLLSRRLMWHLTLDATVRFYAIAILFMTLVFLNLPRIDFFLDAVLFLFAFITMFYFYDDALMKKFLFFYLAGEVIFIIYFALGFDDILNGIYPFSTDILALCFLMGYVLYVWISVRRTPDLRKRFRLALIVSLLAPFMIGPIFKYFLLVPMPKEGLVVAVLDYFWYLEFL